MERISAFIVGLVGAVVVGWLLHHLTFAGWAHSFDTAIYTRSLWGVAHGALHNPIVDINVFSIHANLVLVPLAPLARVVHPTVVLIAAQALAFGACVVLVARELARAHSTSRARILAAPIALTLMLSSAVVINPFLFDVRPDLIAVPLMTAGLLRAFRRGDVDVPAVALMLSSLLCREEMMMVIVGALAATPFQREILLRRWKLRVTGICTAVGYWGVYWFGVRRWMGDGSFEMAGEVGSDFVEAGELALSTLSVLGFKLEIAFALFFAMGALTLVGWRWGAPAALGGIFLLVTSRMQPMVLNFHYVLFVTPGALVAAVAGYHRIVHGPRPRVAGCGIALFALIGFLLSSAFPGGGRYQAQHFLLHGAHGPHLDEDDARTLAEMHAMIRALPDGVSVVAPYAIAAHASARDEIRVVESWAASFTRDPDAVHQPDVIVLPARDWRTVGSVLARVHGYQLVDVVGERVALLVMGSDLDVPWQRMATEVGARPCERSAALWAEAGLGVCRARLTGDVFVLDVMTLSDGTSVDGRDGDAEVVVLARPPGGVVGEGLEVLALRGLLDPRRAPAGTVVAMTAPWPASLRALTHVEVELRVGDALIPLVAREGDETTYPFVVVPLRHEEATH